MRHLVQIDRGNVGASIYRNDRGYLEVNIANEAENVTFSYDEFDDLFTVMNMLREYLRDTE